MMMHDRTRAHATAAQHLHSREVYETLAFGPVIVDDLILPYAPMQQALESCGSARDAGDSGAPFGSIPGRGSPIHEDPTCFMCGETALWVDEYGRCRSCVESLP